MGLLKDFTGARAARLRLPSCGLVLLPGLGCNSQVGQGRGHREVQAKTSQYHSLEVKSGPIHRQTRPQMKPSTAELGFIIGQSDGCHKLQIAGTRHRHGRSERRAYQRWTRKFWEETNGSSCAKSRCIRQGMRKAAVPSYNND